MALTSVREFNKSEWCRYKQLRLAALIDSPSAFGSTYDAESMRTDVQWQNRLIKGIYSSTDIPLIAIVEEGVAGMAWGQVDKNKPEIAHLYQMWVHPDFRGQGIGFALLTKFKVWALHSNALSLHLEVSIDNASACHLYHSFGFADSGPLERLSHAANLTMQPMSLLLSK